MKVEEAGEQRMLMFLPGEARQSVQEVTTTEGTKQRGDTLLWIVRESDEAIVAVKLSCL